MKVAGSNPAVGIVFYTKNASKGIWCSGITRHFDCLEPSSSLGIPVAEWRSLVISSGSCPEDRWFKSYLCNQRAVWWSVLFSTKIFSLLAPSGWILIHPLLLSAVVAQLVEQSPCKRQVISSSLIGSFPNPVNMYDDCHVQRQASLEIF